MVIGEGPDAIRIAVIELRHDHNGYSKVRLGIVAPPETPVWRDECYEEIHGVELAPLWEWQRRVQEEKRAARAANAVD